jgi:signal transduction histidine kinase
MDKAAIYQELEREFLSTFMGELMPGVLHNFANPLNGIMGRAKLLQRRLEDSIKKMEARFPGFAQDFGAEKIIKDINTISGESDQFFNLFRDVADKFSVLACREPSSIDLSQLLGAEIRFADFYLDFKHDIQKNVRLDLNLPAFQGIAADFSLAINMLLISAKERMKNAPLKEIALETCHDANNILLTIEDSGEEISEACQGLLGRVAELDFAALAPSDRGIGGALALLQHAGAGVQISRANGRNKISMGIPYQAQH